MFELTNGTPQMAKLILALAYADTEVKASMCNVTTIQNLFSAIEQASEQLQLITLSAVKRLSTDPMMLPHLEVCLSHHSLRAQGQVNARFNCCAKALVWM